MTDLEHTWDDLLHIQTTGRDQYHHPYEPTPYSVLERLADSGFFGKEDVVVDYGCGKGRVGFFLSHQTKAKVIGIEYDGQIYEGALANRKTAHPNAKADFMLANAEEYQLPPEVSRCYFFNPFSVQILKKVMARILESYYESSRELLLFFYYPSDEFVAYLMTVEELEFYDEIECEDLFAGKEMRERILIFQLPGYDEDGLL